MYLNSPKNKVLLWSNGTPGTLWNSLILFIIILVILKKTLFL